MKFILSILLTTMFIFPSNDSLKNEIGELNLSSENYILYSVDSDTVLLGKNQDKRLPAASINKVLTTITALELLDGKDLDEVITVEKYILDSVYYNASVADLVVGQELTLREVLYAIMLPSGADATSLMSDYLTGSIDGLVAEMNKKAQDIGMVNTNITNTSGLDHKDQYTTMEDLLKLLNYALKNDDFKDIYSKKEHEFKYSPGHVIENQIIVYADNLGFTFLEGAKSGYTTLANRSLSSIANNDKQSYIFISTQAGGTNKENYAVLDAIKVYTYLFNNFDEIELKSERAYLDSIKIKNRLFDYKIYYDENKNALVPLDYDEEKLEYVFTQVEDLKAPLKEGTLLGTQEIFYNDVLVYNQDILATSKISIDIAFTILYLVLAILAILVLLFIIAFIIARIRLSRHRKRRRQSRNKY